MFARDGEVRVERIGLEHHRDIAVARREAVGHLAVDQQAPRTRVIEPGDDPQCCRFSAARRPDQDQEFAIGDIEVQRRQRRLAVVEALRDLFECDRRQDSLTSGASPQSSLTSEQPREGTAPTTGPGTARRCRWERIREANALQRRRNAGRLAPHPVMARKSCSDPALVTGYPSAAGRIRLLWMAFRATLPCRSCAPY